MKLIAIISFLLFICSCEPGGPRGSRVEIKKEVETPESIDSFKEIGLENYYVVEIPEPLKETSILNEDAETQYLSLKYQFGLLIFNEELNAAKGAMVILNPELKESKVDTLFLDRYMQFQINNLMEVARDYDYVEVKRTEISGRDARTFEITANNDLDDIRRVISGTVVEGRSQVYYIYMFYPADKQEEYRDIKNHILESFELNERAYDVSHNRDGVEINADNKKIPKQSRIKRKK